MNDFSYDQWYTCINSLLMMSRNESILLLAISQTYLNPLFSARIRCVV